MAIASIEDVSQAVRPLMDGFPAPWCVAGGWAVDLFLSRVTRVHADVELAIFRQDQRWLHRHLRGWVFEQVVGGRRVAWEESERLDLPVHEIHGRPADGSSARIEFLLNERDADNWLYRRDTAVRMPIDRATVRSRSGLPVLAPDIVLLFKSKSPREKDAADLIAALPALEPERRRWLAAAIATVDPRHAWLDAVARVDAGDG